MAQSPRITGKFEVEHELHGRRRGRNAGVGLILLALVGIVFGLTVVKVLNLEDIRQFEAFDRVVRPQIVPGQNDAPVVGPDDIAIPADDVTQ